MVSKCDKNIECMWTKIKLKNSRPFYIDSVCRPQSGCMDEFTDELKDSIQANAENHVCEPVIDGDIHNNVLTRNTPLFRKYHDSTERNSLQELTSMVMTANSCLNHILINRPGSHSFAGILLLSLSDHHLVVAICKRIKVENQNVNIFARSYKTFTENGFVLDLDEDDEPACYNADDANIAWHSSRDGFMETAERRAPFRAQLWAHYSLSFISTMLQSIWTNGR